MLVLLNPSENQGLRASFWLSRHASTKVELRLAGTDSVNEVVFIEAWGEQATHLSLRCKVGDLVSAASQHSQNNIAQLLQLTHATLATSRALQLAAESRSSSGLLDFQLSEEEQKAVNNLAPDSASRAKRRERSTSDRAPPRGHSLAQSLSHGHQRTIQ